MFSESIGNKGGDVPASTEHTADVLMLLEKPIHSMFSESIGNKGGDVPASTEHTVYMS